MQEISSENDIICTWFIENKSLDSVDLSCFIELSESETDLPEKKFPAIVLNVFLVSKVGVAPFGNIRELIIVCEPPESNIARITLRLSCD
jgi:hypothetical protein